MKFIDLPQLGQPLEGGTFAGVITQQDGTHCAVVLLPNQPATKLNWQAAMDWAASQDAVLPTRPVAALLFANLKPLLAPRWHWASEAHEDDASFAWYCYFTSGYQDYYHKSCEGSAVAVRFVKLEE